MPRHLAGAGFVVDDLETLPLGGYELSPDGADYDGSPVDGELVMIGSRTSGSSLVLIALTGAGEREP